MMLFLAAIVLRLAHVGQVFSDTAPSFGLATLELWVNLRFSLSVFSLMVTMPFFQWLAV